MNDMTVGTCSICGGAVVVPTVWMSIIPPVPTCSQCGATAAQHGPLIQMQPRRLYRMTTTNTTCVDTFDVDKLDHAVSSIDELT